MASMFRVIRAKGSPDTKAIRNMMAYYGGAGLAVGATKGTASSMRKAQDGKLKPVKS